MSSRRNRQKSKRNDNDDDGVSSKSGGAERKDMFKESKPQVSSSGTALPTPTISSAENNEVVKAGGLDVKNIVGFDELVRGLTERNANFDSNLLVSAINQAVIKTSPIPELSKDGLANTNSTAVISGKAAPYAIEASKPGELANRLATMMTDPMTIKNQEDAVLRTLSSQPEYMRLGNIGKEIKVDMARGIDSDELRALQHAVLEGSRSQPDTVIKFERKTKPIVRLEVGPSTLEIIQSNSGRSGIIVERMGELDLRRDINLDTQVALLAVTIIQRMNLDKPFVLALQQNSLNDIYNSELVYSTDGLSSSALISALDKYYRFNNQQGLIFDVSRRNEIRALSQILDGVGGQTITTCLDGALKHAIITTAAAEWSKNIIPVRTYLDNLRARVPSQYTMRQYSALVDRKGYVYYHEDVGNLDLLLRALPYAASDYFIPMYLNQFSVIRTNVITVSSVQGSLSVSNNATPTVSSMANSLINAIQTANNEKVMSFILAGCVFENFQFGVDFNDTEANIVDFVAATLYILFVDRRCMSASSYSAALRVLTAFLCQRSINQLYDKSDDDLRNLLIFKGWPFTSQYSAAEHTLQYSAVLSQGQAGTYRSAFNMHQGLNIHHADPNLSLIIGEISNKTWRVNNNNVHYLLGSVLVRVLNSAFSCSVSYDNVIHRIRGGLPNAIVNRLKNTHGRYSVKSGELLSYFMTLTQISEGVELYEHIDVSAFNMLEKFNDLSVDITKTLQLTKTVMRLHQGRNLGAFGMASMLSNIIDAAWARGESGKFVSETMEMLFSAASIAGKEGFKLLINELIALPDTSSSVDPLVEITNAVAALIRRELSSFGVAEEILICPAERIVTADARFSNLIRRSPFVSVMPDGFPRHSYRDFRTNSNNGSILKDGVILTDGPFNFTITYNLSNNNSYLNSDCISVLDDGTVNIGKIDYVVCLNDGASPSADARFLLDRAYMVYIKTPNNITPLLDYHALKRQYFNADRDATYPSDHTFAYVRN